eukprot:13986329-Ditylum_brightwellii.AAC.1
MFVSNHATCALLHPWQLKLERKREEEVAQISALKDEDKRIFKDDIKERGDFGSSANIDDESDDDEYDDLLDEDPELEAIRE